MTFFTHILIYFKDDMCREEISPIESTDSCGQQQFSKDDMESVGGRLITYLPSWIIRRSTCAVNTIYIISITHMLIQEDTTTTKRLWWHMHIMCGVQGRALKKDIYTFIDPRWEILLFIWRIL